MKLSYSLLALCVAIPSATAAFTPQTFSGTAPLGTTSSALNLKHLKAPDDLNMFPVDLPMEYIQGGSTLRTWKMPIGADRVEMFLRTNGRPMRATAELWLGPQRRTHQLVIDCQDGNKTPYRALLKFKNTDSAGPQCFTIRTDKSPEFPIQAGVSVPGPERNKALKTVTESLWDEIPPEEKVLVQGGAVSGGGGAVRRWVIPEHVESVQILSWSRDVSKKSFKMKVEVLQGPNNKKQDYTLQCGGGSQPYHAVIATPGQGWSIRIQNKKFVEDGLYQFAVLPYESIGDLPAKIYPDVSGMTNPALGGGVGPSVNYPKKEWWE
jgi:hypothetical protein